MIVGVATPALIAGAATVGDRDLAFGFWSTYMPTGTAAMMALAPLVLGLAAACGVALSLHLRALARGRR